MRTNQSINSSSKSPTKKMSKDRLQEMKPNSSITGPGETSVSHQDELSGQHVDHSSHRDMQRPSGRHGRQIEARSLDEKS